MFSQKNNYFIPSVIFYFKTELKFKLFLSYILSLRILLDKEVKYSLTSNSKSNTLVSEFTDNSFLLLRLKWLCLLLPEVHWGWQFVTGFLFLLKLHYCKCCVFVKNSSRFNGDLYQVQKYIMKGFILLCKLLKSSGEAVISADGFRI